MLELPAGVRVTRQRRAVLTAIEEQKGSFTVTDLFDRVRRDDPGVGLATVYRTLDVLKRVGAIRTLGGDRPAYIRCHPGHHHHLVCLACGSVEDTELCAAPSADELERRHGFRADKHEVDIYGTCARCAA